MAVCPSVRLSVTLVYCVETAKLTIKLFSSPGGPIILVSYRKPDCDIPTPTWAPNRGDKGTKNLRFFDQYHIVSRKRCETGS